MSEDDNIDNIIAGTFGGRRSAVANIGGDPDKAARSLALSQAFGVPAAAIMGDLDTFEANRKAMVAGDIVGNNKYIGQYVQEFPLADIVSNDDYHNLDKSSESISKLYQFDIGRPGRKVADAIFHGISTGFVEGVGPEPIHYAQDIAREYNLNPASAAAYNLLITPAEVVLRTLSGGIKAAIVGTAGGVEEAALQAGLNPSNARSMGREFGAMVELATTKPPTHVGHSGRMAEPKKGSKAEVTHKYGVEAVRDALDPAKIAEAQEGVAAAKPWLDAGVEPPLGVHKFIDKIKIEQSKIDLKDLQEAEKDAQASATRERSPEAYAHFVATHGEKTIGISPDAVRRLYGDKVPEADDGKLGFIPRLSDQLTLAELSGGDIRVPLSEWLARVDPEISKELRDDIRVRQGGVTKNEAKALASIDVYHGSPHEFEAFDLGKAGTGEGAQAYGFGHYVAENPEVAKTYKKDQSAFANPPINAAGGYDFSGEVPKSKEGNLYRVRIKRNAEEFLDWDKPFSQQEPRVQEALRRIAASHPEIQSRMFPEYAGMEATGKLREEPTGEMLYSAIGRGIMRGDLTKEGKDKAASERLRSEGIPGIKFLDQGSRGKWEVREDTRDEGKFGLENADQGMDKVGFATKEEAEARAKELNESATRNFVVFSDADLEILSRNGEALRQARASAGIKDPTVAAAELAREDIGAGVELRTKPTELYTAHEQKIVEQVQQVLQRIVPEVEGQVVPKIEMGGKEVAGVYVTQKNALPIIAVALEARDAGKTARHEAIHFLRDYGFFTKEEWAALEQGAREGEWIGKHNIRERYKRHAKGEAQLLEEAIAEEFGEWGSTTEAARTRYNAAVQTSFTKLSDFFKQILEAMKELFGHTPKIDELFEKIESGEVGRRAQEGQPQGGVKTAEPELPGITRMEDRKPFERGVALGMTEAQYQKYLKLIEKQRAEDQAKELERIVTAERRRQTAEWKAHEVEERKAAVEDVNSRRDIQADAYLRDGVLFGDQAPKVKINGEYLTEGQRSALPKSFVNDASGMHPDDLAALFGYHSGAELVMDLGKLQADRAASGMRPMDYTRRLIAAETERRMQAKYGDLRENILEAAKDQMLSDTQLDMLHEETIAAAERAGAELPIKRQQVVEGIREQVEGLKQTDISSDAYLAAAGRAGREAEAALLKQDFQEAFRQKQRQYMAIVASKEAMEIEKEQAQFEAKVKRYMGRDLPKSVEVEYGNYIQQLLAEAGRIGRLSPEEIAKSVAFQGYESLDAFVTDKSSYGHELEVPLGYKPKPMDQMTVGEFRELKAAIDTLDKAGRDEKKINVAGEKQDYTEWRDQAVERLHRRPLRSAEDIRGDGKKLYGLDAEWTKMEEIIKSLDYREERGPFFKAIIEPYELSKAKKLTMITELSAKIKKLHGGDEVWQRSLSEIVPQDFVFDQNTGAMFELTRWNMIKMMLNFGTEQNLNKLAQGIASVKQDGKIADKASTAAQRAEIEGWVHANATAKDWKFVQEIFDLFEGWKGEADTVYRNLAGRPPKWIPAREIVTPHGTFAGGYFPLIPDKSVIIGKGIKEGEAPVGKGPLGGDYYKATTSTPFYKERTGAAYFVDITNGIENLAGRMQQVIHDIAFRDFVVNASKIIYDPKIMNEIKRYYGPEYAAQMQPWLKRVANENTGFEADLQKTNSVLRRFRENLVLYALPLNYSVMFSPSVGMLNLKQMTLFNTNRALNKAFVMENSKELPHILYNLDRDINDALIQAGGKQGWTSFQKHAAEVMMRPLVWLEQQTRMVSWWAEYNKQKGKGLSDTEAGTLADSLIRTQHGAAGFGDLPAAMASKNEFVKVATVFMGYFTTQRNWMRQIPDQVRMGDYSSAAKTLWGTIGISALFNAALFTPRKERDSLWGFLSRAVLSTPMTMIPYVRDGWNYWTQGFQAMSPISSMIKSVGEAGVDGYKSIVGKKVKNPVKHTAAAVGQTFGVPGALQMGRTGEFAYDVAKGEQRPRNIVEWMRGIFTGEARLRK